MVRGHYLKITVFVAVGLLFLASPGKAQVLDTGLVRIKVSPNPFQLEFQDQLGRVFLSGVVRTFSDPRYQGMAFSPAPSIPEDPGFLYPGFAWEGLRREEKRDWYGCPAAGLANGLFVEVEGSLNGTGVVASKIQCAAEPSGASVEREGVAAAVDVAGTSFSLATEHGTVGVKWTDTTFFGGIAPQTLSGKPVHVEGVLVGGVLIASKVKFED